MEYQGLLKLRKPLKDNHQHLFFENYEFIHCEYSFHKQTNKQGEVQSDVKGGIIKIVLPILPTSNLLTWSLDSQKRVNGELVLYDIRQEVLEKIYFEEARCTYFRLHYEPGDSFNVVLLLTINVQKMLLGEIEYKNRY